MRKVITRRQFLASAGTLALLSAVAACTPAKEPEAAPTEAPKQPATQPTAPPKQAQEKLLLRVQMEAGALGVQLGELCAKYSEANPGIDAKIEEVPWADLVMKTELGFATGDLPDSLFSHTTWHWLGCYKGWYRAIDDLLDAGVVPDYDDFYEIGVENQKFEGKTYGLPDSAVLGPTTYITWNRGLLEKAGVQPPNADTDLWDLYDIATKVAKPEEGIFGVEMYLASPARLEVLSRCWGKPEYGRSGDTSTWLTSPDGKKFNYLDNVGVQEIFTKWYTPLVEARVQPKAEDQVDGGLFVAGKSAIYQGHQGHPQRFKSSVGDKWEYHTQDCLYLPPGPDGRVGSSWHTHMRCISGLTKQPEETMKLAAYLTSHEAQMIALKLTGNRGARKSVYGDPSWSEEFPHYKLHDEILRAGKVEPFCMPWNLRINEFEDIYAQLMDPLINASTPWAQHGPLVQKEVQQVFDLPRP